MNKKMRDLLAQIKAKTEEAKTYANGTGGVEKNLDKAAECMAEVAKLQQEFEIEKAIVEAGKLGVPTTPVEPEKKTGIKALADAARAGFKAMNEGTPADGGYTVPEDIQTAVNEYKSERFSLRSLIDYEEVNTKSGRRTYKTRSQNTGFAEVAEGGKITKVAKPQFEVISYNVKKYAGYLPVTNELLEDSDEAIAGTIIAWLGEEGIATENAQILAKVNAKAATTFAGIKDIKKAVNVTLAAFAGSVKIVTNSDGLQYLDTLEDKNGRPLLSPDPKSPMNMSLSIGARTIPVVVVPNDVLKTSEAGAIPFIVGDLKEYLKEFDRKQLTISRSDVAVIGDFNAYEQDMQLFRGIMRADWTVKDSAAIVRGELTPAT